MHTDESVNAYITGELLAGESFRYDPRDRHGPALFAVAAPLAKLLGVKNFSELTETQLRLSTVLTGAATVLLFGAGVEMFGFIACLVAALLFAFAPLPIYYNRYFIHESLFVAATLGLILSGRRALQSKSHLPAALAGFCAALMLACKETAVIHFFALAVACRFGFGTPGAAGARTDRDSKNAGAASSAPAAKAWLTALAVFLFTVILLFTWFGRNWSVFSDMLRAIPGFAARAGGEGHEKPIWYYAGLLAGGWSGAAMLGLAALGMIRAFRPPRRFFPAVYALLVLAIYSAIPYKTPWLALNFWLPLAILAGIGVEWLWSAARKFSGRVLIIFVAIALGCLLAHDTSQRVFVDPAGEGNPYAYAHTGEDLLRLPGRLEELTRQHHLSHPRIAVVAADPWPLPWYLRKFSQAGFWQPGQETGAADFFITSMDVSDSLAGQLNNFRPEYFGARPNVLLILWVPMTEKPAMEASPPPSKP